MKKIRYLKDEFDIEFNSLLTITNMPINRFGQTLKNENKYEEYYGILQKNFKPDTALNVMCRDLLSISWDGNIDDFSEVERDISFENHCFVCTTGSGSFCTGALV